MDAFDIGDNLVMRAYNSNALPKIKRLLRIIEIILILVFLTSATTRLPLAVKAAGEYLRRLVFIVVSPFFIFLLGNVIVLTLFFKSRHDLFGSQHDHHHYQNSPISTDTLFDFRQEIVSNIDESRNGQSSEDNIVFQDKQTIFEVTRSTSKVVDDYNSSGCGMQLHRSETETVGGVEVAAEMVDGLSNEEFKREVEAFIARQIKFHQQEKLAIVLHSSI
ncbi:hypothetical protein PHJA_000507300 [Phtheirospermum japonicum]|uniref:DUF4408 domain-containing protein n=1 Tax=Phtheirospermum japonicum TaxID=374723 RepID=A0A830BET1_9LAMI|nr:hypothetical protein PHJA_000507300 [Phtheirospermum japonicum]